MLTPTNCDDCGACCMGQNFLPVTACAYGAEVDRLPAAYREALEAVLSGPCGGDDGCPCIWLDRETGKCRHHELRPDICREFEIGGEDCLRIRRKKG